MMDRSRTILTRRAFEGVVQRAMEGLPEEIQRKLENIAVVVEDIAPPEIVEQLGLHSPYELLGLYQGVSIDRRGFYYGNVLPDKISLYQRPIEGLCRSTKEMIERIQETVLHELGHYFGLDDQQLHELLSRSNATLDSDDL